MAIYWGLVLNCVYDDSERAMLGALHPRALGMPACELLHTRSEEAHAPILASSPVRWDDARESSCFASRTSRRPCG